MGGRGVPVLRDACYEGLPSPFSFDDVDHGSTLWVHKWGSGVAVSHGEVPFVSVRRECQFQSDTQGRRATFVQVNNGRDRCSGEINLEYIDILESS